MFSEKEYNKIRGMTAFVAGAGGLGTHQILELQRTGVKKIYLLDYDRIVASNLNRQILYGSGDIGKYKAERAKEVLDSFALGTEIVQINEKLSNDYTIPEDVDIVFDAFDNFEARFILDDLVQKR
ncbi:MAG: HesA/MoeB/ThiF family protein, partial [Halanaerobiales bacterium]